MIKYMQWLLLSCSILLTGACGGALKEEERSSDVARKKIVLIPGTDSHGPGEHEHLGGCTLLAKLLNEEVPGVYALVTEQGWPKDTTVLDDADAIVMYSDGGDGHMAIPHLDHLDRLMKKGVGLLNIHYAVEVPAGEAGDYFLKWVGGYFEIYWSINPFWTPGFDSFPNHPVTHGVPPFEARDEWYYHMRFNEDTKGFVPILKLHPPVSTLDRNDGAHEGNPHVRAAIARNEPQVMAWAYERPDGGRGFGFTGGHVHNNWKIDGFRKLVVNAIAWVAKIEVPDTGFDTSTPTQDELDALRKNPE
ncbi:MAG: ThuA domain-containing protein [Chitinophagaceae bacterium]|nr:ThuA domain-containing protein [Chitinophagaceae bacterium]MCW5926762.1 ThuA domain-containing protein [Chitinophagaceae bacterium]